MRRAMPDVAVGSDSVVAGRCDASVSEACAHFRQSVKERRTDSGTDKLRNDIADEFTGFHSSCNPHAERYGGVYMAS